MGEGARNLRFDSVESCARLSPKVNSVPSTADFTPEWSMRGTRTIETRLIFGHFRGKADFPGNTFSEWEGAGNLERLDSLESRAHSPPMSIEYQDLLISQLKWPLRGTK